MAYTAMKCESKCGVPTVNIGFVSPFLSIDGSVNKIVLKNSKTSVLLFFYIFPCKVVQQTNGKVEEA